MNIYIKYPIFIVGFVIATIALIITVEEFLGLYYNSKSSKNKK